MITKLCTSKIATALTLSLLLFHTTAPLAVSADYNDKKQVLNTGFELDTDRTLEIANPSSDSSTTYEHYYITGSSNPDAPLTCNGEEVADRGVYGSFGIYAPLEIGENRFVFENGADSVTLTITRTKSSGGGGITTITNLRKLGPSSDDVVKSGETYRIRCTAPANGEVTATLDGKTYSLEQEAVATTGVEAYYSKEITLPEIKSGTIKNLGQITYQLTFDGKSSSAVSDGTLYLLGEDAHLLARVNQNAAILYEKGDNNSNHVSLISRGAVDTIEDANGGYFQLGMGSWISKSYVDILDDGTTQWKNKVSSSKYKKETKGESLVLNGTASPSFKAYHTSEKIVIYLYNTTGVKSPKLDSDLFSSVKVTTKSGRTMLEFFKKEGVSTVGYDVSFDGKGKTTIFFNPMAAGGSESQPLREMTIVVDPGHGGLDSGALGILNGKGPVEKDITMAHALVLKNRLEGLGANVILSVQPDQDTSRKVEMTDRVEMARKDKADFYVSLHCNSIDTNANGLKPSGTEIYYYENNSKMLANSILEKIGEYNNRSMRSVIHGYFYVTRNPICPSMLIEMGFISNPKEYDELCTPESMYQTANAIADVLVEYLDE